MTDRPEDRFKMELARRGLLYGSGQVYANCLTLSQSPSPNPGLFTIAGPGYVPTYDPPAQPGKKTKTVEGAPVDLKAESKSKTLKIPGTSPHWRRPR